MSKRDGFEFDPEPDVPWQDSAAKSLLFEDLMNGDVPLEAGNGGPTARQIYESRPEFIEYHWSKFTTRLGALCKFVKERLDRAKDDEECYLNYIHNHEPATHDASGEPVWEGSDAQRLLKLDMDANYLDNHTIRDLFYHRDEYSRNFTYRKFYKHVHQEIRLRKYENFLELKAKKHQEKRQEGHLKQKEKHKKQAEEERKKLEKAKKKKSNTS